MLRDGTAKRCDCHGKKVMAVVYPQEQAIEIKARGSSTAGHEHHVGRMSIHDLIAICDPFGTTYQRVGTG